MTYYKYRDAILASDLTSPQKMVALVIAYHYNWKNKKPAYPSNKLIAKEASLAPSTVVKAKRVLQDKGWLISKRRMDDTCEYTPCSPILLNNEYNNEVNNVKIKDSSESLVITNNINPKAVNSDFPLVQFRAMAAQEWK